MIPGTYALNIYRGDDHAWRFVLWADTAKAEPLDLTGFTVKAEIRDRPGGAVIVPLVVTVTLPNTIDVGLPAAISATTPSSGRWDLQLTDTGGQVATVLAGPVKVIADVTDSTVDAARARTRGYRTEPAT